MNILADLECLRASTQQIAHSVATRDRTLVFACAPTHKAFLAASLGRRVLYIAPDDQCEQVARTLTQLGCRTQTMTAPFDVLVYRRTANLSNVSMRLGCLAALAAGDYDVVVASPKALLHYVPRPDRLRQAVLVLRVGQSLAVDALADSLSAMGYARAEHADTKGTFAVLGEVVELFPLDAEMPVRLLFDYDELAGIKYFQPETMQGMGRCDTLRVLPATDMLYTLPPAQVLGRLDQARTTLQNTKATLRTDEILSEVAMALQTRPLDATLAWALPVVRDQFCDLFAYLPADAVVAVDEPKAVFDQLNLIQRTHRDRVQRMVAEGEVLRCHKDAILTVEHISRRLTDFANIGFSNLMAGEIKPDQGMFVMQSNNLPAYCKDLNLLVKDLAAYHRRGVAVRLYCGSQDWVNAMRAMLGDVPCDLSPARLDKGFVYAAGKCVVVGTHDMSLTTVPEMSNVPSARVVAPKVGDYVVHEEYGIGQCLGVQHIKTSVGEMDYMVLQYAGTAKIYVPMHQLSLIKLYAGSECAPKLSNPNKEDFKQQKAKARTGIRKLAFDLLELYARRQQATGYRYPPDTPFQREFEAAFEFEETPDQLQAVADIKRDMEQGRVMDRLICGDVGFGKTEVALRAVFKTVMENKQAAILAPTTILAEQHFMTVSARLQPFGVRVACLSRFRTAKESRDILQSLARGTVSVVVGTHRLLSKDVEFFDLGLLVLDEEQRFGVEHKEKIKTLRNNINVLSMSATPIPRTLHMALSGIRDVSVLDTPPKGRRDVETVIAEYSDGLLVDAVMAELNRGGQAFVLYNSVEKIYAFYDLMHRLMPDVSIVVGHGQMSPGQLEGNVYKFYNKEAQVLLATTIIENGIDVPNANTLFVVEAHRLGLAQMYQLKGRVGRSSRQAIAYFTYPEGYVPTGDVAKRFEALSDNAGMGSGYRLALRDLEIRGAGDVLGSEQHGHVQRIGYDMYCRLLRETIALLKGEVVPTTTNTEVSVNAAAYIPDNYVTFERERLRLYQRIASISSAADSDAICKDMADLYGPVPPEVRTLVQVSLLRVLGSRVGVQKVEIDARLCVVRFVGRDYLQSVAYQTARRRIGDECKLTERDTALTLQPVKNTIEYKMQLAIRFLNYLNGNYR